MAASSISPARPAAPGVRLRLEARSGDARAALYEPGPAGFLIGSVPGCDMRLPGVNLPPVIALIARHPAGATLRKLAPVLPVLVNGQPVQAADLANGDVIGLGPLELVVHMDGSPPPAADPDLEAREQAVARRYAELEAIARKIPAGHGQREQELTRQEHELTAMRKELAQLRGQFADRFQERRDKLLTRQQAVHRAGRKVAQRKRLLDGREVQVHAQAEEAGRMRAEAEAMADGAAREGLRLQEQARLLDARQARAEGLERSVSEAQAALDAAQRKHQAELVRLDRIQAGIDQRQRQLDGRAAELDARAQQLEADGRAAEEHGRQMDEWHARLTADAEALDARRADADGREADLARRAAALEGQQATVAALRGRLEKLRDELRQQEQVLADQRAMHDASEADLRGRVADAERLRAQAAAERQAADDERRQFDGRRAILEQATAQLREARDGVAAEQEALEARAAGVERLAAEQRQQAEELLAKGALIEQTASRVAAERQALRDREAAVGRSEQALAALQQQVQRRAEDVADRERHVEGGEEEVARLRAASEESLREEQERTRQATAELEQLHQELLAQATAQDGREQELGGRERAVAERTEKLIDDARTLAAGRQAVASERRAWEVERQAAAEKDRQAREELAALLKQLPEAEARTAAGLEKLLRAREQMAEVQAAARQGRDELKAAREQIAAEAERVRLAELDLGVARDEHRHAAEGFRQQLLDWQTRLADMRQAPAVQAADTQEWYRRKLRDQAGVDGDDFVPLPSAPPPAADGAEPGDRQLGEVLGELGLIDADTLEAVLGESRRQRRSLRQLLLAGGYLTLYQMALIEAGNLDGLTLGPVRVIEKLASTPREAAYRVFDPRHGVEGLLRHLAESEMADAVRPDEFRSRFGAASGVRHANVAAVREVLDLGGRPAALLEWVSGLPSGDWPGLAAAPGAWYRLVCQAALALHAAHEQGMAHGRLEASSFVLTADGTLKLIGLGEPHWLTAAAAADESAAADVAALGRVAAGWAATPPGGKAAKSKPLPEELGKLVSRAEGGEFETAKGLIEELERVGVRVPASGAAWERLLKYVQEQSETKRAA